VWRLQGHGEGGFGEQPCRTRIRIRFGSYGLHGQEARGRPGGIDRPRETCLRPTRARARARNRPPRPLGNNCTCRGPRAARTASQAGAPRTCLAQRGAYRPHQSALARLASAASSLRRSAVASLSHCWPSGRCPRWWRSNSHTCRRQCRVGH